MQQNIFKQLQKNESIFLMLSNSSKSNPELNKNLDINPNNQHHIICASYYTLSILFKKEKIDQKENVPTINQTHLESIVKSLSFTCSGY